MPKFRQPSFFHDQERGREKEIFIDYYLSWTLRCAVDVDGKKKEEGKNNNISEIVQKQSKFVLLTLLKSHSEKEFEDYSMGNTTIDKVETEKQWENIDLFCILELTHDTKGKKNFILAFENKMYSPLEDHQLQKYTNTIENHRKKKYPEYTPLYFLIHYHPKFNLDKKDLLGYLPIHFDRLTDKLITEFNSRTGNALFDEFWYNYLGVLP